MGEDPRREAAARADHRCREGVGSARPRRRRLPDRHQVELHAAQLAGAEVSGLQLRRERARHLPRSRHPALQPARADRGPGDRRLRHQFHRRLQLHPGRIPRRAGAALRGGAAGNLRRGPPRQEHPRHRDGLRHPYLRRRRRLHLRRGDCTARVARGQAGQAALQAAVSRQLRRLWPADDHQQHAEFRHRAYDPAQGSAVVRGARAGKFRRHRDLLDLRARGEARQLRAAARHSLQGPARARRRRARRPAA